MYFDGHDREDVIEDRKAYCALLSDYEPKLITSNCPTPRSTDCPVIRIFHDESTFNANADQSFHWADDRVQALKQKSLGQAIMISDFIEEVDGYLRHEDKEARVMIEHQVDGYWNNSHK